MILFIKSGKNENSIITIIIIIAIIVMLQKVQRLLFVCKPVYSTKPYIYIYAKHLTLLAETKPYPLFPCQVRMENADLKAEFGGFHTWRFMGSYKWGYKSLNTSYNHSSPTYNPTYNYP